MTISALTLNTDPQVAIDNLNNHVHDGILGRPIPTTGIADGAVTTDKTSDGAITTPKLAAKAVTTAKLGDDVAALINAAGGIPGIPDYIASGRTVSSVSGLMLNLNAGVDYISGKTVSFASGSITLPPRMASLLVDKSDGTTAAISAALPAIDNNTVARWIFNQTTAGAHVPNSAVGNSIAVANDLVPSGGLTSVDGMLDYAIQGDGSTGSYVSQNSTGFPAGTAARTLRVLWTCRSITENAMIGGYGNSAGKSFIIYNNTTGALYFWDGTNTVSSSYYFTAGQTYLIEMGYDGSNIVFLINGKLVYKYAAVIDTISENLVLFRSPLSSSYFSNGIIHMVELRNVAPTEQTSGPVANKLLFPCRYLDASGNTRNIIDDVVPSGAISIGYAQTGSTAVNSYVDASDPAGPTPDYAYGLRIGALEKNRRKFLGYQYYSGKMSEYWDNPFGTRKMQTYYTWAQDAIGTNECDVWGVFVSGSTAYGVQPYPTTARSIGVSTQPGGVVAFNGSYQTSGYIGCYVEVLD